MPGMKAMSLSAAKKVLEFVKTGGTLICVSELPLLETEYAKNDEEFYVFDFTSSTNIKNFDTKTVPDYAGALLCYFEKDGHTGFMGCDMIHSSMAR